MNRKLSSLAQAGVLIAACCVAAGANDTPPPNLKLVTGISCSVIGPNQRVEFATPSSKSVMYDSYRATAQLDYAAPSGLKAWVKLIAVREGRHTNASQRVLLRRATADCDQWVERTRRQVLKAQGAR